MDMNVEKVVTEACLQPKENAMYTIIQNMLLLMGLLLALFPSSLLFLNEW